MGKDGRERGFFQESERNFQETLKKKKKKKKWKKWKKNKSEK